MAPAHDIVTQFLRERLVAHRNGKSLDSVRPLIVGLQGPQGSGTSGALRLIRLSCVDSARRKDLYGGENRKQVSR